MPLIAIPQLKHRVSVMALFGISGWIFGNLTSRLGDIQVLYDFPEGALGWALVSLSIGNFLLRPFTAKLIERFGISTMVLIGGLGYILSFFAISLFTTVFECCVLFMFLGSSFGVFDQGANILGAQIERNYKQTFFSSIHGVFSASVILAAFASSWFISEELSLYSHFIVTAVVALLLLGFSYFTLPPLLKSVEKIQKEKLPLVTVPVRATWVIGIIALCSIISEASVANWMSQYITDVAGSGTYMGPWPLAAFSLAMMLGRFLGDGIRAVSGDKELLRDGSILAAVGLGICIIMPDPIVIILGVSLMGLGLSVVVPIAYSLTARIKGIPLTSTVSMIGMISTVGTFLGPAIISSLAQVFNIRISFFFIFLTISTIIWLSQKIDINKIDHSAFLDFEEMKDNSIPQKLDSLTTDAISGVIK